MSENLVEKYATKTYIDKDYKDIVVSEKSFVNLVQENKKQKEVLDKIKEYGENCLENLKDQDDYIDESINVVALLKMIHKNYLELLEEIE